MILFSGTARMREAPAYPIGLADRDVDKLLHPCRARDYQQILVRFFELVFPEPGLQPWREFVLEQWKQSIDQETFSQFRADSNEADWRHLLPSIDVPTLVIGAGADRIVREPWVRYVAENIPGATYAVIRGAGHSVPWTGVDVFQRILTTWLETGALPRTEWDL